MKIEELIGRRVMEVLFTEETIEGTTSEEIYLVVDDGRIFTAPDEDHLLSDVKPKIQMPRHSESQHCEGKKIFDVLYSDQLPFYSLLLEGNKLLTCGSPTPARFGWYVVDYTLELKNRYEFSSIQR